MCVSVYERQRHTQTHTQRERERDHLSGEADLLHAHGLGCLHPLIRVDILRVENDRV